MGATLKDLYNALKADGRFSETKDFGTFAKKMNERGYSSMVYNTVRNAGANVPDIATFRKNLGVHVWKQGEGKQNVKVKPTSAVGKAAQSVEQERWGDNASVQQNDTTSATTNEKMPLGDGRGPLLLSEEDNVHYPKLDDKSSALVRGMALSYAADQENKPTSYTKPGALVEMEKSRQKKTGDIFEQTGREYATEEYDRQNAPAFRTGANVNDSMMKRQGQLEKELAESAGLVAGDKSVSDYLSNAIFGEFKEANERASQVTRNFTGAGTPGSEMGLGIARSMLENQQKDPEKLLKNLQEKTTKSMSALFSSPDMKRLIEQETKRLGVPVDYYVQNMLAPKLQERLSEEFDKAQVEKYLPEGTAEYVMSGINDSMIGTLLQMVTMNKKQREYMQRANAITQEGLNPNVGKPSMWTNAARGAVSFVADAPLFRLLSPIGTVVAGRVLGGGIQMAARIANTGWRGRMGYMAGQGAISQSVTGFLYGGANAVVQNYSTGEDTSLANTMRVGLSGGASEGASWAVMGGFGGATGGALYKVGLKGTEKGMNAFWKGAAKVGSGALKIGAEGVGMHLGGNVANVVRGEDTNWFSTEGILEDCANVVALKLTHAHKVLGKAAGVGREKGKDGKKESYTNFVARNLANYFASDAAKGARFKFTEDEKKELFGTDYTPERNKALTGYDKDGNAEYRLEGLIHWALRTKGKKPTDRDKAYDDTDTAIKSVYERIMSDENISWDTKAKYNALVMGTAPSVRPMMDYWNVATHGDKKVVEERAKDGTLLSRTTYNTADAKEAIAFRLMNRREAQRTMNAYSGLLLNDLDNKDVQKEYMRSLGYDFENPDNPRNKTIEESMAKARNDYENGVETPDAANNIYKGWIDFAYERGELKKVVESFLEEKNVSFADYIKIIEKYSWERTDAEREFMTDYRRTLEKQLFPEDKVHEEQSQQNGKDVAEENNLGSELPNEEAVKTTLSELTQAEQGLQELMDSNEVFALEYKRLREQGLSNAQMYQELINSGMTQEELMPFAKYINANAKVQGMVQGTQKEIDKTVKERVMDWSYKGELNGEKQSGENMVYVTDDEGRTLVVASGDVAFDAEGKPKDGVGDMLVVYDATTGEMDFVSAKDVKFHSTESAEDYANKYAQYLQELNSKAYVEAQQEQQSQQTGNSQTKATAEENSIDSAGEIEIGNEKVLLSDEVDDNGKQFVLTHDGNLSFGEVEKESGLPSVPILLSEGMITNPSTKDGYGLVHIEARHGNQIRKAGYKSVLDFIENVAKNYEVIKEGNKRNGHQTYRLQLTDKHNNTLMVELSSDGSYWNINTAGIFKTSYGKKNKEVYNRHTTEKQSAETAGTSQNAEQSGTQASSRMNVPTSSLHKDSNSSSEDGENKQTLTFKDGTPIPMTTDSKGRAVGDLTKMTPEHGAEYLETTLGEMTDEFVDGKIAAAEKAVDKAKKKKVNMSGDAADVQEAIAKKNEAIAKAEAELAMYTGIKKTMTEKRVKAAMEAAKNDDGDASENSAGLSKARERFEKGPHVAGYKRTRTLNDGTRLKGHYELVEAESLTPSHDANNGYKKNEDFPVNEEGSTVNDRDYEHDKEAQMVTDETARNYNGKAVDNVPVVTKDGIVVDGNGRTMAGQKAAKDGTDTVYLDALKEDAENFGFTAEQIDGMKHPRLVFVADESMSYDTATFAKFNKDEKKAQNNTHQAIANTKKLTSDEISVIVSEVEGAGSLDAFFNNPAATNSLLKRLIDKGVIGLNEVAALREGEGKLSAQGKDFVKNLLLGSVFSEDTIRMMGEDSVLKTKALNGIRAVIENMKLGEYALTSEIDKAMQLLYEARQNDVGADAWLRTPAMFEGNAADRYDPISQAIALALEGKAEDFRELMLAYNKNAKHFAEPKQLEMFGEKPTKEEIVKEFLKLINWNNYETRHSSEEGAGDAGGSKGVEQETRGGSEEEAIKDTVPAETQKQVSEAVKGVAVEITKQVGEDVVVTDDKEAEKIIKENETAIDGSKLRFQIKTPEQRKAAENAYNWAQQNRPSEHETYAVVDMSRPDSVPQYFEKKDLAKHFKKYWSVIINGEYKLVNLDKTFEENVKGFTGEVPDVFNPEELLRYQKVYHGSGADFDHVRFFRTKDGEAYGFTDGKRIYLDTKKMKPDTPLHEYTHLWGAALRRVNAKEWENVKGLLDKVDGLKTEIQKLYPELKGDDLYDEMLAMFSGREGTKKLEDVCRKLAAEDGKTVTDSAKEQGFIGKVKTALQTFWKGVADLMHIKFTTAEEVADKVLADWARGFDPREKEAGKPKVEVDYEHPEKNIHITNTSSGYHRVTPFIEEWQRKTSDIRLKKDGWGEENGLTYYIEHFTGGRGGDNVTIWFKDKLSDEQKRLVEIALANSKSLGKEFQTELLDIVSDKKEEKPKEDGGSIKDADPMNGVERAAEKFKEKQRERNGQQKEQTPEEKAAAKLKEQQEHPLTKDEIDTYNTGDAENDEMAKEYAKDYLNGDRNPMAEFYYNEIYDNVRNRQQDGESDSSSADTPHMDGGIDAAGESGRDGGTAGRVDGGTSGEDIPGGKPSGESREGGTPISDGERSNKPVGGEASTMEGVSARGGGRRGSRKSGGAGVADTRPKSASESKGNTGSDKQSAKAAFEESGKEISDIFAKLKKLREENRKNDQGKLNAYPGLASAVVGELAKKMLPRSKEEFALYSQLMKACIKHAYNGLRLFGEKAETWYNGMKESLHDAVKDVYGDVLSDEDVDNFIKSMWDTKYTIDGKRQTIEQWAAEMGHEKLREALRKPLEQKRKEQQAAEKVAVKVGDAANIAETLPFLLPAQQEDVLKAEKQFFDPSHVDDAHGGGRGMMFTNGTGTGKTYTGLGIAKRFIKQGKGRVLIVTPSPAKVNDWSNDAKNLGITLTPLKGETGKGATMQKGEGAVVTTFANFRQNRALMEDTFDLVIYDESHKLMENKDATESATTFAHYRMTNKDFASAMERLQLSHPLWKEAEQLEKEKSTLIKGYEDAEEASMDPTVPEENVNRAREIEARLKEIDKEKEKILPELTKKAREAVGKTKVVFLSATPFNMRENIEYTEGYLFNYPIPKRPDNISEEEWGKMRQEGKNTFFRQWFPNGERIGAGGKIEPYVSDADKSDAEERNFADHLMSLGVMSGRTIDNGYDYSRDFPMVSVTHANTFNTAVKELSLNPQLRAACSAVFNNYNVMSVVYETMKVAAAAERIKQHLAMGRKVVIFHRRVNDRMGLARPPFASVLEQAEITAAGLVKSGGDGKMEAKRIRDEIAKFREKYKDLLDWEQTLDYRMPREQLASLLGDTHDYTPEEMQTRNDAQARLITPLFNGRSDMDAYEAGREFAKSCFDFEDADIVEQYKPHQVTEEEAEMTGEKVTSAAQHKKDMAAWRAVADKVKKGVEDVIRERVQNGELKIELDEKGKKKRKVGLFAGADSKNQKIADMDSFNNDDSGMDVMVVQESSGKEGISLHDTTGKHQRVMINLALPQSPIAFIQAEGRIYRIGQKSNAIFEYPLLGIDNEISLFAGRFNTRAATTENLALGNMARGLKNAIMRGVLAKRGKVPLEGQGYGGRDWDMRDDQRATGYDAAVEDWKNEHKDDQTGTIDDVGTPQPLGFKLVDWAQMSDGERTLEPSAGEGNVSRYFPSGVKSLSIEPDANKYNTLMLITGGVPYDSAEASSRRTTVANKTFEDMSSRAKYDTIVMNSPNGAEGKTAEKHLELAVAHLNDSGRIVAVLPETERMDKFVKELIDGNPSLHLSGEVKLPACAYSIGGVSQKAKVVVIDMLKREEMRKKWGDTQSIDLSEASDINDFFAKLKDVKVPDRVLDPAAKDMQHANNVKTVLSKIKAFNDGKTGSKSNTTIEVYDNGIYISPERKFFRMTYRKNSNYTYKNVYGEDVYPYVFENNISYKDIKQLRPDILTRYVMYSDMAKMSDADIRNNFFNEYAIKSSDEAKMPSYIDAMRQYGEAIAKMIRGVSGRSDAQLRRAAKGEDIDNPVNVKAGTKMTIDDYKALFEANNEDEELGALFNRVYDVAKKLGMNIDVFNDENTGTSAYYDNSNQIRINEAHWNKKKIVNSQGKIVTATKGLRAQVLCHELIHSVTSYANYWYDNNPEYLPDNLREAAKELDDVYNRIMHSKESYKIPTYARENKDELVAEMANPEVREPLKKMGIWTRLVNAVKKFFMGNEKDVAVEGGFAEEKDFEQSTAYNELSKTLDKFLNNFDKDSYDAFIRMSGTKDESVRNMSFGERYDYDRYPLGRVEPGLAKKNIDVVKADVNHGFKTYKEAKTWAKEHVVRTYNNEETGGKGDVRISNGAIDKFMSQSAVDKSDTKDVHMSVLKVLPDVLRTSIDTETHPDFLKGEDGKRSAENGINKDVLVHRCYGAVSIGGKPYRVKITLKENVKTRETTNTHSYEATKIELLAGQHGDVTTTSPRNSNNSISAAKLLDGVEKSYDKGKKLLDESKDLTDGEVHFRLGNKNLQPREQSESDKHISATIDKMAQQTGGKVKQVHNVEEIENEQVRKDIEAGKEVTGWYDEKTGEVHLYMPNIHDSYTAEKTVWHETVGHKGMRGLLGDKFHTYLRSLWMDMDSPVFEELHKYVKERMAREPMSMYDAIEEFVAEAAEKGKGEAGFWNNIRNKVTEALRSVGYRLCPNVKDVKYMLWLAKNVQKHGNDPVWKMRAEAAKWKIEHEKTEYTTAEGGEIRSVDGKAHDFESMTQAEWDEATDGEIHYRTSPSAATATDRYHRMLSAHGYMATEAYADNMASVERLMRALDPKIKKIEDVSAAMNPYMLRTVLDGSASDKMQRFEADVMQPLDKYMARLIDAVDGKNDTEKIRNFNLYMIKKHGLERNRVFFVRDAVKNMDEKKREQTLADFNAKRKALGVQLRKGGLMLSEYYTQLDEWICNNVNKNYKAGEHDYSGMHGMYGIADKKSPYDDIQVQDEVMSAERAMEGMERGSVEKFWGQVKVATQYALDEDYKNGFVTKANHENVSDMFDWYVPLRKFDEATAEDVYGYVTELGDSKTAIGPAIVKAKGRKSLSETNILAQIGAMANYSVVRGSQNKLKQAFALFVRNKGGQGLVTETKAWVEKVGIDMNGNPIWQEVFPDIKEGDTADAIAAKVEAFEQDMKQKQAQGLAKNLTDRGDIGFKFERKADKDQHYVDVMIAGKTHRFVINGNPRAAQALNGQLENSAVTGKVKKAMKSMTRFMAQMATSYNPEFVMRNAIRDAGFALQNVTAKEGARYAAIYKGYYLKMLPVGAVKMHIGDIKGSTGWGLYAKYRNGTLDTNKEIEKWFKEFMENGGETGFVQIKNLQQWEKQYKRDILRERSLTAKSAKAVKDFFIGNVECANEVVENMARFAAYCASRHMKRSIQRCAYDAKQVSVNFNRHGSGDAISSFETPDMSDSKKLRRSIYSFTAGYFRNYSMFFNAGVQGTQLMFSNVKKAPVATIGTMMATPFAFGIAAAMVNAMLIGNEDEKKRKGVKDPYAELPEYIRRNNLCIYLGEGKFVTIPLAIEHRAFYGLGDIMAGLTTSPRLRNERNLANDMVGCLSQLFPVVDFMNLAQTDKHPVLETAKGVLPTTVAPFAEWLMNSDWKGAPIRRVGDYTENRPSWKNAYSSTPERLIALNKWANAATNDVDPGNPNMKGADWADALTDPSMLNHIIGTLGGGAVTTTMRMANAIEKRRDTEWNEIPIGRNFGYAPNERTGMARTKARWYNYVDAANKTIANYKELGNKNVPVDERIANIAARFKFENTDEYRKVDIIKRTQKQLKRMRKLRNRSVDDKAVTDAIDEQMNLLIQDAVSRLEDYDRQHKEDE